MEPGLYENIENGTDYPTYKELQKIADYYNVPMFFFFTLEEEPLRRIDEKNIHVCYI